MPNLTAANFNLQNATAQDIADLNAALAYLQTDYATAAVLQFNAGSTIIFDHNGVDKYNTSTDATLWDPRSGLGVHNNGVTGVQSAALGLYHELVHRYDPNIKAEGTVAAEYYAVSMETIVANFLGEPTRDTYTSTNGNIPITNTTEHTDKSHWQYVDANGNTVVAGAYNDTIAPTSPPPVSSGGGDGDTGCVSVDSILPDGRRAGEVSVGSLMELGDEHSLKNSEGMVTFSQRKTVPGFRITTTSGVSLKCSDTAPIPTPDGLVLAPNLLGKKVPVRRDDNGVQKMSWEIVESVESIGLIEVQHITVGNKCFWAGEKSGAYILHHNLKDPGGDPGDPDDPDDDFVIVAPVPSTSVSTAKAVSPTPFAMNFAQTPHVSHAGGVTGGYAAVDNSSPPNPSVLTLVGIHESHVSHY